MLRFIWFFTGVAASVALLLFTVFFIQDSTNLFGFKTGSSRATLSSQMAIAAMLASLLLVSSEWGKSSGIPHWVMFSVGPSIILKFIVPILAALIVAVSAGDENTRRIWPMPTVIFVLAIGIPSLLIVGWNQRQMESADEFQKRVTSIWPSFFLCAIIMVLTTLVMVSCAMWACKTIFGQTEVLQIKLETTFALLSPFTIYLLAAKYFF